MDIDVFLKLEKKIEGIVEGVSNVFRGKVQPLEIAKRMVKEAEHKKVIGLSHIYVPNKYKVFLSKEDIKELAHFKKALTTEISAYLREHFKKNKYTIVNDVSIDFLANEEFKRGQVAIESEVTEADENNLEATIVKKAEEKTAQVKIPIAGIGILKVITGINQDKEYTLEEETILGRSEKCQIIVLDQKASRHHASIVKKTPSEYTLTDLGSSNGTLLNGLFVKEENILKDGDEIQIGDTVFLFQSR